MYCIDTFSTPVDFVQIELNRIVKEWQERNERAILQMFEEKKRTKNKRTAQYREALRIWRQYHRDLVAIDPVLAPKYRSLEKMTPEMARMALELITETDERGSHLPKDIFDRAFSTAWREQC